MKRFLAALVCAVVLCVAASAVALEPVWMTLRDYHWVTIGDYHLTLPEKMVLVTEEEDENGVSQSYVLEDGAEGKIEAVVLIKRKIENVEVLCETEENWKTVVDVVTVQQIANTERLTETVTNSHNLNELIFARLEAKGTNDGKYYNFCFVRGKGDVLTITAVGDAPIEGETIMEKHLYYGEEYGYTPINYKEIRRYPDRYYGFYAIIEGEVLQVMGSREKGFELRVATAKGEKDELVIYVPRISMPDYNFLDGDKIKAYVVLQGEESFTTVAGATVTVPYAGAMGIGLKDK
nr:MAG TPA: hypothetical protein [Caudoviricetes sp.]